MGDAGFECRDRSECETQSFLLRKNISFQYFYVLCLSLTMEHIEILIMEDNHTYITGEVEREKVGVKCWTLPLKACFVICMDFVIPCLFS